MGAFTTVQLLGMYAELPKFTPFFLQMFFPNVVEFASKEIAFDKVVKGKKLAPFVSPMVAGRANRQIGKTYMSFEPAYVKPKDIVEPGQFLMRAAGEAIGGQLTPVQRRSATVVNLLDEQEQQITRREEWMAVQAVLNGAVIVEGEDYPAQEVSFGRDTANNIALAGAAKWDTVDTETYDPTDDLTDWADASKAIPDTLVMSKGAWKLFHKFKQVREHLDTTQAGQTSALQMGPQLGNEVQYKGRFGEYSIYVYAGKYEQADGTEVEFMPGKTVLMAPSGYQGVRCYGAIQDAKANAEGVVSASRYPKSWFTDDPSTENLMTQSAPLMVTPTANDFVVIEVA